MAQASERSSPQKMSFCAIVQHSLVITSLLFTWLTRLYMLISTISMADSSHSILRTLALFLAIGCYRRSTSIFFLEGSSYKNWKSTLEFKYSYKNYSVSIFWILQLLLIRYKFKSKQLSPFNSHLLIISSNGFPQYSLLLTYARPSLAFLSMKQRYLIKQGVMFLMCTMLFLAASNMKFKTKVAGILQLTAQLKDREGSMVSRWKKRQCVVLRVQSSLKVSSATWFLQSDQLMTSSSVSTRYLSSSRRVFHDLRLRRESLELFPLSFASQRSKISSKSSPRAQQLKAIAMKLDSILLFSLRMLTSSVLIQGGSYLMTSSMVSEPSLCLLVEQALLQRQTLNLRNSSVMTGRKRT